MKKYVILLFLLIYNSFITFGQTKGVKIGYIDMEYILQNVSGYTEAKNQLEEKALKWKKEIEQKKVEIAALKESLKTEQVLLTKELVAERQDEINAAETTLLDYQQKRFGPNGDLIIQKTMLAKPIQDQVFNTVQDISEAKKYDFIFDKTSDLTILFAAKKFDISDQVLRVLNRAEKREQVSKKQLKLEEAREAKEEMDNANPGMAERQRIIDEKKLARDKLAEDKKLKADEIRKSNAAKRQQLLDEKNASKNTSKSGAPVFTTEGKAVETAVPDAKTEATDAKKEAIEAKQKAAEARTKALDERKKAIEDRKKKIIEDREAAKKAKEELLKENQSK
jgi:Skp family chaperone for outer membrane proteins